MTRYLSHAFKGRVLGGGGGNGLYFATAHSGETVGRFSPQVGPSHNPYFFFIRSLTTEDVECYVDGHVKKVKKCIADTNATCLPLTLFKVQLGTFIDVPEHKHKHKHKYLFP